MLNTDQPLLSLSLSAPRRRRTAPALLAAAAAAAGCLLLLALLRQAAVSPAAPGPLASHLVVAPRLGARTASRMPSVQGPAMMSMGELSLRSPVHSPRSSSSRFAMRAAHTIEAADPKDDTADQQSKGTILVVGATGTLGRQVVRRALSDGYQVRCLVRARFESEEARRVLQGWGATIVGGDLGQATSIPPAMIGVDVVIDCATARPEEPLRRVDWDGKVALIETAQALGVDRYIFFSIDQCEKYPEVKLMDMKAKTEQYLAETDLNYTVFRLCGFMQALISSYAIPIVEGENVWGTDSSSEIAYINSIDAARLALTAVENENTHGQTLTLSGPQSYTTQQVIDLCEKYSGSDAKVIQTPGFFLKTIRGFLNGFKWAQDAADRLAFAEVISQNAVLRGDMKKTCDVLGVDPSSLTTLPDYLESFFNTILSKVQKIKKSEYVSQTARDLEI